MNSPPPAEQAKQSVSHHNTTKASVDEPQHGPPFNSILYMGQWWMAENTVNPIEMERITRATKFAKYNTINVIITRDEWERSQRPNLFPCKSPTYRIMKIRSATTTIIITPQRRQKMMKEMVRGKAKQKCRVGRVSLKSPSLDGYFLQSAFGVSCDWIILMISGPDLWLSIHNNFLSAPPGCLFLWNIINELPPRSGPLPIWW